MHWSCPSSTLFVESYMDRRKTLLRSRQLVSWSMMVMIACVEYFLFAACLLACQSAYTFIACLLFGTHPNAPLPTAGVRRIRFQNEASLCQNIQSNQGCRSCVGFGAIPQGIAKGPQVTHGQGHGLPGFKMWRWGSKSSGLLRLGIRHEISRKRQACSIGRHGKGFTVNAHGSHGRILGVRGIPCLSR